MIVVVLLMRHSCIMFISYVQVFLRSLHYSSTVPRHVSRVTQLSAALRQLILLHAIPRHLFLKCDLFTAIPALSSIYLLISSFKIVSGRNTTMKSGRVVNEYLDHFPYANDQNNVNLRLFLRYLHFQILGKIVSVNVALLMRRATSSSRPSSAKKMLMKYTNLLMLLILYDGPSD